MDRRDSEALDRHITGNYGEDSVSAEFDESNPMTWTDDNLPAGYKWTEVNSVTGEYNLFSADGRNITVKAEAEELRNPQSEIAKVASALNEWLLNADTTDARYEPVGAFLAEYAESSGIIFIPA